MPFHDFDVIIEMDWLHRHHVIIDCRLKQATFETLKCIHVMIQGQRHSMPSNIISATKARQMMRSGCIAYLAHVVDTRVESPIIKDILTMCDFENVFL